MRFLFSGVPALGHLLPLVPLARAARDSGHDVAVLTSAGMAEVMAAELSGVPVLGAGPMPGELFAEVARRIPGSDPAANPEPEAVAEFFAGTRVDLTFDDALAQASAWQPDVIVSDAVDFVGPLVAAALSVPSALVAFGPDVPIEFQQPMFDVVASRYAERNLLAGPPLAVLDPTPALLQAPGWVAAPFLIPFRSEPHRRDESAEGMRPFPESDRARVLVTLGTVFGDDALLAAIIRTVRVNAVDIVATVAFSTTGGPASDDEHVHYEAFRPMAELLDGVDIVVGAGGAGTVLAALSRGIPLVLLPQGADQFINSARAEAAGAAIVIDNADAAGTSVARLLADRSYSESAWLIRYAIAERPDAAAAIAEVAARVLTRPAHSSVSR